MSFFVFILSATILCCWVLAMGILQLWHAAQREDDHDWGKAIQDYPASLILVIYVFCVVWFVGGLTALHTWLVARNVTTYEHFRHRYGASGNPYDKGILGNFVDVLFSKIPARFGPLWEKQIAEDASGRRSNPSQHDVPECVVDARIELGDRSVGDNRLSDPTYETKPTDNQTAAASSVSSNGRESFAMPSRDRFIVNGALQHRSDCINAETGRDRTALKEESDHGHIASEVGERSVSDDCSDSETSVSERTDDGLDESAKRAIMRLQSPRPTTSREGT